MTLGFSRLELKVLERFNFFSELFSTNKIYCISLPTLQYAGHMVFKKKKTL